MNDLEKILAHVAQMRRAGKTPAEIGRFLEGRGYTPASFEQAITEYHRSQGPSPITARDIGRSVAQGATMEFADELAGLGAALVPGGRGYRGARNEVRANDDRFRREHPRADMAARLGGGLAASAVPVSAAVRGPLTLGQTMRRGAGVGAGLGAATGLGAAEGPAREQARSAAVGAAAGGVLGAAAPPLMQGAGALARGAGRMMGMAPDATATANTHLSNALARGGTSPEEVQQLLGAARADAPGLPVAIADVAGAPAQRMARGAASQPTAAARTAEETLIGRDMGRGMRLEEGLTRATGQGRSDLPTLLEEMDDAFRPRAQQMYDAAYTALDGGAGSGAIDDAVINRLLDTPAIGEIWEAGLEAFNTQRALAAADGRMIPELVPIVEKMPDGTWARTGLFPDTRTLDFLKRGMDAFVDRRMAGPAVNKPLGVEMARVRDRMLARLDEINPAYRDARSFYRGGLDANRALESGQRALSKSRDEIAAELRKLSTFEQGVYRLAAQDALRQRLRSQGGITTLLNPKNREFRERLRMLFETQEQYQQFMREVTQEGALARTERVVTGGSPTARIQAEQAMLRDPAADLMLDVGQRGMAGTLFNRLGRALDGAGMNEEVADKLAERLLTVDPGEQTAFLRMLAPQHAATVRAALARRRQQMLGSMVGGLLPVNATRGE